MSASARILFVSVALAGVLASQALAEAIGEAAPSVGAAVPQPYIPQIFPEPLQPAGTPDLADTHALSAAITAYQEQPDRQDLSALDTFVRKNPRSAWTPSLLVGLGRAWYDQGRYSRALEAYEQAFRLTKNRDNGAAVHAISGALYAKMLARVGRRDELAAFFEKEEAAKAALPDAKELLSQAKGGLWTMKHCPGISFRCGSMALYNVGAAAAASRFQPKILLGTDSPQNGFSLQELVGLGAQANFPVKAVKRIKSGAAFIVPAVVHWKIGHYAAITERSDERFMVEDPTFGDNRRTLMSTSALEEESSGYFLVSADAVLPDGWVEAGASERGTIRGRGFSNPHDAQATTTNDKKCPECPEGDGTNPRMAGYSITSMLVSLNITDTPIEYHPPLGAPHRATISYNERETMQPNANTYGNFSPRWSWNWSSSLTVINFASESVDPGDIDVYMPGGGGYTFRKEAFSASQSSTENGRTRNPISYISKYQRDTRIRLTRNGIVDGKYVPVYTLEYPDGSKAEYGRCGEDGKYQAGQISGKVYGKIADLGTSRRYFLSRLIDPQGNATCMIYDQNARLKEIVSPSPGAGGAAKITTIQYDTDPAAYYNNPYVITKVTTPDARAARFTYDQHGTKLVASTDPLGMSSIFEYDSNDSQRISKLHTPYGTTSFRFGESPDTNSITRYRWIEATDPMNATERVEFNDGRATEQTSVTGIPYTFPTSELPAMRLYNSHYNQRSTFYWDKRAYPKTTFATRTTDTERSQPGTDADYGKADVTHWLIEFDNKTSRLPEWERKAGENYVFYNYQKNSTTDAFETWSAPTLDTTVGVAPKIDESAMVSVIGRLVPRPDGAPGFLTQLERFAYNNAGRLTRHKDAADRETLYSYDATLVNLTRVERVVTRNGTLPANWTAFTLPAGWATQLLASFTYHPVSQSQPLAHLVKDYTDAARTTTTYNYNTKGQVLSATEAYAGNSRVTTYQYSPTGLPGAATAASAGYPAYVDGPLNGTQDRQTFEWNATSGALKSHTDESGYTTTIVSRDAWLRPLSITYTDGSESFDYQENPHPAGPSDEEALPSAPSLDYLPYAVPDLSDMRLHRLARHTARDGHTYYYRYDNLARPTSVRDETGAAMLTQSWCACGALEWFKDRKGQQTSFSYYDNGHLWKRAFPAVAGQPANVIIYAYDIAGRLSSLTNGRTQVTNYLHTLDNRVRAILHPTVALPGITTPSTFFTYDPVHPRLSLAEEKFRDPNTGDFSGPLTLVQSSLSYSYHPINPTANPGAGQIASVTTTSGTFNAVRSYTYDGYGRLNGRTYADRTEAYTYDPADRPATKNIPGFGSFTYAFEAGSSRLKSITRTGGLAVTYNYYPVTAGAKALRLDNIEWEVAATSAALATHTYGYKNQTDSPIQAWRIQSGAMDNQWIFDYAERPEQELVSAVQTGGPAQLAGVYSYGYDEAGNRRTEQSGTQPSTTEYNARNQATSRSGEGPLLVRAAVSPVPAAGPWLNDTITMQPESTERGGAGDAMSANTYRAWVDLPAGDNVLRVEARDGAGRAATQHYRVNVPSLAHRTYAHDEDGNLTTILEDTGSGPVAIRNYVWDSRNRMIAWGNGTNIAGSFIYDSAGHRLAEKDGGGNIVKYWIWEGPTLLGEYDGAKTLSIRHYPEGYERVSGTNAGDYFYTRDHLGSVRDVVNASNTVTASFAYDPFGRRYQTHGTETVDFGYTGHYYHQPTGLWLSHFRAYDSNMGRWISRDPMEDDDGLNLYAYVSSDPANWTDSTGLSRGMPAARPRPQPVPIRPGQIGAVINPGLPTNAIPAVLQRVGGGTPAPSRYGPFARPRLSDISSPQTPVGRRGQEHSFPNPCEPQPRNVPGVVHGRHYSGHAFDRMQERGFTPSVIESTIATGRATPGHSLGTTQFTSAVTGVTVTVNSTGGVITAY
jgi:RHS repeat-associated protein